MIINIHEAKTNLSKLIEMVQNGEEVIIAKYGKPVVDLKPHNMPMKQIVFGQLKNMIEYKDIDMPVDVLDAMFDGDEDLL